MNRKRDLNLLNRTRSRPRATIVGILLTGMCLLSSLTARAGSATWKLNPTSTDWNTAANWTPRTVPSEMDDVATFGVSNVIDVSVSEFLEIGDIVFEPGAGEYRIAAYFGLNNIGVINNSGVTQHFETSRTFGFFGMADAGSDIVYTNNGNGQVGERNSFLDDSTAGSATFIMNGALPGGESGVLFFLNHSSAANSTIINNGPRGGENGGQTDLLDSSSGGDSTIVGNPGSFIEISDDASAANARLIIAGGEVHFEGRSTGGMCQVELSDDGLVQVLGHSQTPLTIGSLAGEGTVQLLSPQLGIGSNGLDTTFSGVIEEGGTGDRTAALNKVGSGTLTFSGVNSYRGGTTVEEGTLLVQTANGSATGTGPVQVNAGTFGGRSNILGAVTIGSGSGAGAFLAPGIKGPGVLVIRNTLTFKADGTYACELNIPRSKADQVIAKGVTIENGAQFAFSARGNQAMPVGTVFTVINNRSAQPISGTFANLPNNSTFSTNGNTFQVSYEGGDENDLTLTVVP